MKAASTFCLCTSRNEVHHTNDDDDQYFLHEQALNSNLSTHGMERFKVKGDGNCLFYALAQGLIYEMKIDPIRFGSQLETYGLSANFRVSDFSDRLRKICIDQWKLNEQFYSQFVDTHKKSFQKE